MTMMIPSRRRFRQQSVESKCAYGVVQSTRRRFYPFSTEIGSWPASARKMFFLLQVYRRGRLAQQIWARAIFIQMMYGSQEFHITFQNTSSVFVLKKSYKDKKQFDRFQRYLKTVRRHGSSQEFVNQQHICMHRVMPHTSVLSVCVCGVFACVGCVVCVCVCVRV